MIAHTFPPFGTVGGSVRLIKFLRFMKRGENGWQPTVITLSESNDLLWLPKDSTFSLGEVPPDVRVLRTSTSEPRNPSVGGPLLRKILRKIKLVFLWPARRYLLLPDDKRLWGTHMTRAARQELTSNSYQLIYATAPPFSVILSAVKLKQQTGLPLVMDVKDDWVAEERFRGLRCLRRPFESRMEARCVQAADRFITVTRKSYEDYRRRYPEYADKFVMIPNGCDMGEYRPYWDSRPEKFQKFTLIHTGIFSDRRDLSPFFRALRGLLDYRPEARARIEFLIVGRIPASQAQVIREQGLDDVIRNIGYLDRNEFIVKLIKAHLPVVINYDVPTLVPGKLYEYWGSRNRMLLLDNPESAAADLVRHHDLGDIVEPCDENGIHKAIEHAFDAWVDGRLDPLSTAGLEQYDRRFLTGKLESVFDEVI